MLTRRLILKRGAALALGALPLAGALAGCQNGSASPVEGRTIQVTATVGMVADTVRRVGGDRVEVQALMGPGVDPHLYSPRQSDVQLLSGADIIFYNGLLLEGKMVDLLVNLARKKPVVAVAESVDKGQLREPPEFQGHYDPHIWFDVSLWSQTIDAVVDALSELDPSSRSSYEANGEAYRGELQQLHEHCKTELATIPKEQRVLVTAHDAFGYFGRAYDVEVVGLQGMSTVSEASLDKVNDLVNLLVQRRIPAVFVESSVPQQAIKAVVEGCRARGHTVKIGGTLYSDAMGEPGTPEGTYPGMVRHNVKTIVAALK
ncbi:MAG: metal ABC transporter solute-binding protein, Zn/Mn family [Armatimonadota bacterium]